MAYIYRHIRMDKNEPFYIGIGTDNYFYRSKSKKNRNKYWENIVNKTDYKVQILLEDLTWEEACEKEMEFIALYGRKDLGKGTLCNLTDGGEGIKKCIHSEETKQKIRKKLIGIKLSEEHKANIAKGQIGSKRTIDTKIKMSKKIKEAYKNGKLCNKGKNNGRCKQVIDLTTGFFYNYAGEAFKSQNQFKNLSYFMSMLNGYRPNKSNFKYI
jgi:hypothetical protein